MNLSRGCSRSIFYADRWLVDAVPNEKELVISALLMAIAGRKNELARKLS
jgi:hypothetical protein